jgi:hypothetical protein
MHFSSTGAYLGAYRFGWDSHDRVSAVMEARTQVVLKVNQLTPPDRTVMSASGFARRNRTGGQQQRLSERPTSSLKLNHPLNVV